MWRNIGIKNSPNINDTSRDSSKYKRVRAFDEKEVLNRDYSNSKFSHDISNDSIPKPRVSYKTEGSVCIETPNSNSYRIQVNAPVSHKTLQHNVSNSALKSSQNLMSTPNSKGPKNGNGGLNGFFQNKTPRASIIINQVPMLCPPLNLEQKARHTTSFIEPTSSKAGNKRPSMESESPRGILKKPMLLNEDKWKAPVPCPHCEFMDRQLNSYKLEFQIVEQKLRLTNSLNIQLIRQLKALSKEYKNIRRDVVQQLDNQKSRLLLLLKQEIVSVQAVCSQIIRRNSQQSNDFSQLDSKLSQKTMASPTIRNQSTTSTSRTKLNDFYQERVSSFMSSFDKIKQEMNQISLLHKNSQTMKTPTKVLQKLAPKEQSSNWHRQMRPNIQFTEVPMKFV